MKLNHIKIKNFRNITSVDWSINSKMSVITGENGAGKTNLLEAVYLLLTLRPIRTGRDFKPLIKKEESVFFIKGDIVPENGSKHELSLGFGAGKKNIMKNGISVKPEEYLADKAVIFFSPDETTQLVNSPDTRRRLVDRFIFSMDSSYFKILSDYKNLLKQRNAILKQHGENKRLIYSIDKIFLPKAFEVSKRRCDFIKEISPFFSEIWSGFKPHLIDVTMKYKTFIKDKNGAEILDLHELEQLFSANLERDIKYKTTTTGPHRDDIIFSMEETPIKNLLSHGERKAAALAFNFGFVDYYKKKTSRIPLILLDDIKAEIDDKTFVEVMKKITEVDSQVIMTSLTNEFSSYNFEKSMMSVHSIENGDLSCNII